MSERPPLLGDLVRMVIKMLVGGLVVIGLISCGVATVAGAGAAAGSGGKADKPKVAKTLYGKEESKNAILRVDINGPILTHRPSNEGSSFFGSLQSVTYGYDVKEQLLTAAKDDSVKAVMLFVSTPGGSIVGSQAIHEGVLAVKAANKPVVAYIDSLSASGGVWSTAAADKIFADHGSLIGSVGVIFGIIPFFDDPVATEGGILGGGISTRGGIKTTVIAAAEGKDLFNPYRPVSDREKSLLEASAKEYYTQFLDHVTKYRPLDRQKLVEEYGAMVFSNNGAQARGYTDGTKNFQDTLAHIAAAIGAEGDDWKLVSPPSKPKSPFESLFEISLDAVRSDTGLIKANAAMCSELRGRPVVMSMNALTDLCGA